jgi:hypothetical protein
MRRTLCACALVVVAAATASCSYKIFDDIGSDPHPPSIEVTALVHYVASVGKSTTTTLAVAAGTVRAPSVVQGRSSVWDSGGFTLTTGKAFQIGIAYSDAGGDILKFRVRDRDGATSFDLIPTDQTYFSGTSGALLGPATGQALAGIAGPHRLELWAEDSHLSRSEKVEFIITLTPP